MEPRGRGWKQVGKRVLLVDDDRLVLESVAAKLEAAGYRVWASDTVEEAVGLAAEVEPDVVVTDYRMPGRDGISLLERLMVLRRVPRMVVYSATPPPGERCADAGFEFCWVAKAAGHATLLETLRKLTGDEGDSA